MSNTPEEVANAKKVADWLDAMGMKERLQEVSLEFAKGRGLPFYFGVVTNKDFVITITDGKNPSFIGLSPYPKEFLVVPAPVYKRDAEYTEVVFHAGIGNVVSYYANYNDKRSYGGVMIATSSGEYLVLPFFELTYLLILARARVKALGDVAEHRWEQPKTVIKELDIPTIQEEQDQLACTHYGIPFKEKQND